MPRLLAALLMTIASAALSPGAVWAFSPDEPLDDPAFEQRALDLHNQLRCLVCQGQSIADSNAELARDLRRIVRERIAAGDSDQTVTTYLTDRYGDFILLRPPIKATTYVLWFGPALVLVAGGVAVFFLFRRRARRGEGRAGAPAPLTDEERGRLAALLDEGGS